MDHASVPAAYEDATGRIWVYFLYFGNNWPQEKESIWVVYENDDGSVSTPQAVVFTGGVPSSHWTNNPAPILLIK